ncbi:MAG TPA: glycerol-3-phosphate 1-O-acyltransferase [Thermoleophilaceae bacterium]|nr:glycerol-3-phosphate 1-O-acyltransferase [Thermoleophilaceae bacterium]
MGEVMSSANKLGQAAYHVNLVFAESPVERSHVDDWLTEGGHSADTVYATGSDLASRLADSPGDPLITPVGVAWLPPERGGVRRATVIDVLTRANPRRPNARRQRRIVRHDPARSRVVVGAPALLSDLRERFERTTGRGAADGGFGPFVARQGRLALEREERAIGGQRYKVPRLVAEEIGQSGRFAAVVEDTARQLGEPASRVREKATAALDEMVASQSRLAVDAWDQFTGWMARAYTLDVDERGLDRVRELGRDGALVFLPSHRSYLDPMVLRHALADHGFPPNHILGGINVAVWPIGPIARRSGMIFIKRSFRDAPVHKAVLREYIAYLLRKRFSLEWYIEGGRSRTGKLRPPRYGLLAYLVDAVKASPDRDVHLVPVSIVYDQLPEIGKMAAEDRGRPKAPESFRWLVGYARSQSRPLGRAHVTFGEPLALGRRLAEDDSVPKVAFEICHRINRVTPVTPMSMVTLAMLGAEGRGLTLEEGRMIGRPVIEYLNQRGLPVTSDVKLGELDPFHNALAALVRQGVVTEYPGGAESVYAINPEKHQEAAFYRNASIHFLVNRAIVELALLHAAETAAPDLQESVWQEALRLRDLLKFEFFFARKREFAEEVRAEAELMAPGWEQRVFPTDDVEAVLFAQPMLLAPRVLRPFVEAYRVVAEQLVESDPSEPADNEALVARCLAVGLQQHARGRIVAAESISAELFAGALRLASNRGLSDIRSRKAFAHEVTDVDRRIGALARMATRLIPGQEPSWTISNA